MNIRTRQSRPRRVLAAAVCIAALAACSSTSSDGSTTLAGNPAEAGTSSEAVVDAQSVIDMATSGLIVADKPEASITAKDWVTASTFTGPPDPVKAPAGKKIYAIACASVAPFCDEVTKGVVDAAEDVGWDATYLDGAGSPQGFATAFATALAGNPDAIVTMAIPESVAGTYIAQAHAQGVKVIGISSVPEAGTTPDRTYDAYVSARETANAMLQAWWVIADSGGSANIGYLWDPAYPFLTEALEAAKTVFGTCGGCVIEEVVDRQLSTAADPVKYQQLAESLIQRHPDLDYILLPYGLGTTSVIAAVNTRGADIKVVSKNSDPVNIGLVNQGSLAQENGTSPRWVGFAGLDQTIRVLAGEPPLEDWQANLPVHVYTEDNAPATGSFDWEELGYEAGYREMWGVTP